MLPTFPRLLALLGICGFHSGGLLDPFGSKMEVQKKARKHSRKNVIGDLRLKAPWACLPPKKRLLDPLLPQRLAEYAIGSNTPMRPEGTVAVQIPLVSGSTGVPCWDLWGKPPVGWGATTGVVSADLCSLCSCVSGQRSVRYVPGWRAV